MNKTFQDGNFILFFTFLGLFSCISEYEVSDSFKDVSEVVVNGVLVGDSIPEIYLNRTMGIREESTFEQIEDALVILYYKPMGTPDNWLREERLFFLDSCYKSDLILSSGHEYRLEVQLADGRLMTARTSIPEPVRISSARIMVPAGFIQTPVFSGSFSRIEIFVDVGETIEKKFFEVYNYSRDSLSQPSHQWEYNFFRSWNSDGLILREGPPEGENYAYLFQLSASDDPVFSLSFDFIDGRSNPFSSEFYPVLNTTSKEYFLYKKSLYSHLESLSFKEAFDLQDLYFPSIFKILQPIYSNINGGTGIFAGLSSYELNTTCNVVGFTCQ